MKEFSTLEDYKNAPVGTIVKAETGDWLPWFKGLDGRWYFPGGVDKRTSGFYKTDEQMSKFPSPKSVIWEPGKPKSVIWEPK